MGCRSAIVCLLFLLSALHLSSQSGFQKQLDSLNGIFCLEQTADGTFWLGTFLGKIIRLDADGQWLGGYTLRKGDTASTRFIYDLEKTPDGGVWALFDRNNNNTALDDYLILAKLAPDGAPVWQTPVHYGQVLHWAHNRLGGDPDGNIYVLSARFSSTGSSQPSRLVMTKVAPDGSIVWSKILFNNGVNYPRTLQRLNDGSFLICGNGQLAAHYGFILRIAPDGTVIWSRRYDQLLFKAFAELPDGGWVFAATETGPLPQSACVLRTDSDGNIAWAKRLEMPNALNWLPGLLLSPAGDVLVFNYETPKDQPVADMICLSPAGDFLWAKRYDLCHNYGISAGIITNDGGIAGIRYRPGGHLLLKTDASGACSACPAEDVVIPLTDVFDTPVVFNWQSEDRPPPLPATSDFFPFSVGVRDYCEKEKPVTGISLVPEEVCLYQPIFVTATGNGQADNYQWKFPGGLPAALSGVKSVGGITFDTPGDTTISLVVKNGFCQDTFDAALKVLPGPLPFSLGPDTVVCGTGALVKLDASAGEAQQYEWSDGMTGPVRTADGTGDYIVTASTGACIATDTIRIQVLDNLNVMLPGDTTICGIDTIWLDATTPNAESYRWSDGVETARRAVTEQGYYAVTAFLGNCSASDFVAVNPFPSPASLPSDTLICAGEPLVLRVGNSVAGEIYWNGEPGYAEFEFAGTGWVRRVVEYRKCRFEDSIYVYRADCRDGFAYFAPNVFAPYSSGENAFFEIFGVDLEVLTLQVYDRWGNMLHSVKNENPARWDGRVQDRLPDPGVYIWVAQIKQRNRSGWISGDVLIVR